MALNAKQLEIIDVVADILSNEGFQRPDAVDGYME